MIGFAYSLVNGKVVSRLSYGNDLQPGETWSAFCATFEQLASLYPSAAIFTASGILGGLYSNFSILSNAVGPTGPTGSTGQMTVTGGAL